MMKNFLTNNLFPMLMGFMLLALSLALLTTEVPGLSTLVQRIEWIVYDLRMNAFLPDSPQQQENIVIVDIDDKSLLNEGHWPWPRNKLARLVDKLFANGAVVVAFDIMFAEAEPNAADKAIDIIRSLPDGNTALDIKKIQSIKDAHDNDRIFADSLRGHDVVLGYMLRGGKPQPTGSLPAPLKFDHPVSKKALSHIMSDHVGNIDILQQAARNGGYISVFPDKDGTIRRYPLVLRYGGALFPSIALEAARLYYVLDSLDITTSNIGGRETIENIIVGDYKIPTDGAGRVNIPYIGKFRHFSYVSATDILHDDVDKKLLENRIVLVGTTAEGLYDLRSTPVDHVFPGIEIQANTIAAILDKRFPHQPSWAEGADFVTMLVLGALLAIILPLLSPVLLILFIIIIAASMVMFNFWLWSSQGLVLTLSPHLIMILLLGVFNLSHGFVREAFGRHQLKDMFGQYVPPELVEEMNVDPASYSFEGESREMTVLFADIRNFTSISEAMPALYLKQMLNDFFTPMTEIIFNNRGTIDKYVGDMIMAFWGAPLKDDQHARHAVNAAMEMLAEVEKLKPDFRRAGYPEINIGIAINTGTMTVGDMGSQYRRSYTVLGDAVNLASRLEGLTKYYGANLVINETTRKGLDDYLFRRLDLVRVKGKKEAVHVFQPICLRNEAPEKLLVEIVNYENAMQAYLKRDWQEAQKLFEDLLLKYPKTEIYKIYMERIDQLSRQTLPKNWDGVYERRTK